MGQFWCTLARAESLQIGKGSVARQQRMSIIQARQDSIHRVVDGQSDALLRTTRIAALALMPRATGVEIVR